MEQALKRSTDRILTTHTGSLPRPADLITLLKERQRGNAPTATFTPRVAAAIEEVVQKQRSVGLDIVNDGEQSKPDYSTYIKDRLDGFGGEMEVHPTSRDGKDFPEFFSQNKPPTRNLFRPCCNAPISWRDFAAVEQDIAWLKAAVTRACVRAEDTFMTAVSPGQAARFLGNRYYRSHEEYLNALADVLKKEYDAIAQAGFILQLDCPDLASGWNNQFAKASLNEFRDIVRLHIDVLNRTTRDVPADRLRIHLCWGNYAGPHNHDIPLREIIDLVLACRATAFAFEGANPRHAHEWHVFETVKLPDGKMIIPGVIDSTSNYIEHPQVVADRIVRLAKLVGRENVIAGVDCGFSTFAEAPTVHPSLVWAKLSALAEGARLASKELWTQ
jgi:5-methyltetrahydropteroyltriglutamate--homocysteine methyltransferase